MPLSTLQMTPHDVIRKTRGQDGFATSFPAGILPPLQHVGLSRRSPVCRSLAQNAPELYLLPVIHCVRVSQFTVTSAFADERVPSPLHSPEAILPRDSPLRAISL